MPNRYVCEALSEVRTLIELQAVKYEVSERDKACMSLLIEEIQTYVNRMETSLGDKWDMHRMQKERSELSKKRRELRKEVEELTELRDSYIEEEDDEESEDEE